MSGSGAGAPAVWLGEPEKHDFPAAASYLSLVFDDDLAARILKSMESAKVGTHKAKDLLRAAQLPLLDVSNPHVASDLAKVGKGEALSPVLLVRGDATRGRPLIVADGYHRICASYHLNENTDIPAVLVEVP